VKKKSPNESSVLDKALKKSVRHISDCRAPFFLHEIGFMIFLVGTTLSFWEGVLVILKSCHLTI